MSLKKPILDLLTESKEPMAASAIANQLKQPKYPVRTMLRQLVEKELVESVTHLGQTAYILSKKGATDA